MRRAGCLVVLVAALAGAQPASASHIRYVTFAARYCPTYAAINANEARNNIQESLQPLGADTPYGPNDAMDPVVEQTNQPLCKPLAGWKFTLGTGYQSRAVPGPWGNLSKVTGAYADAPPASPNPVTTLASTPLLNPSGVPTGTIAGAVTLQLTEDQVTQASKANNLWVMGGTPTDPVATPANYAFGALRCGVDNLNGDNVEWVTFPSNSIHVFCFAYYVTPPPPAGTIIVRKRLSVPPGGPDVPPQTFRFTGNLSFTPDPANPGDAQKNFFDVKGGDSDDEVLAGQQTFPRAAGSTWTFRETPPQSSSATFAGVQCTSSNSTSTVTPSTTNPREVSVELGPADVVTCTFTNNVTFSPGLFIRKITTGGLGTFEFAARRGTDGPATTRSVTTTKEGIAATASPIDVDAGGKYTITESPPMRDDGHWEIDSTACGGQTIQDRPVQTTIPQSGTQFCTFTNRFVPTGSIKLRKVTLGATATTTFLISPDFGTPATFAQSATTTEEGKAVLAVGDDSTALPLGTYAVREMTPSPGPVPGSWRLDAVVCNGTPVATAGGGASVTLTRDRPKIDCTVTNQFVPLPEPPPQPPPPSPPPIPTPTPLPDPVIVVDAATASSGGPSPLASLVVTKRATPTRVILGQRVRYLVTVRNRGPAVARAVTLVERQTYGNRTLTLSASQGRCRGAPPRFCAIGSLAAGQSATVTVTVRPRKTGRFRNVVATNTATPALSLRGKTAAATIVVVPRPRPHFTG
jgi:hypothetical protein